MAQYASVIVIGVSLPFACGEQETSNSS